MSRAPLTLSATEARQIALRAQGIGTQPGFDGVFSHLQVLQIDSVNVFSRSHYMPFFSRIGAYSRDRLDDLLWKDNGYTEYWAHEAASIPVEDRPLFSWRMKDFQHTYQARGKMEAFADAMREVKERLAAEGPLTIRKLETVERGSRGPWWGWSDTKRAVEMLFAIGEVVSVGREQFMRRYALTDTVFPEHQRSDISRLDAHTQLMERAATGLGVGTLADFADYYRLPQREAKLAISNLEEQGILTPVEVDGWIDGRGAPLAAWLHRDAPAPRRVATDTLLTPFDPLCWFRPRTERLFGFHYRLEIYTPEAKRQYGYYCLPLMLGGRLVGRIDVKADRQNRVLLVQSAWQEPNAPRGTPGRALTVLERAAAWQGLEEIRWSGNGNLPLTPVS